MTVKKHIAGIVLGAALLAPSAAAAPSPGYGLPRALPSDYATVQGALPRAMPADYERSGVAATRAAGMPRAMPVDYARQLAATPVEPGDGFDWIAAGIGALAMLGAVLLGAAAAGLTRRNARKAALLGTALLATGAVGVGYALAASTLVTDTDDVHLRIVKSQFADGFTADWHTHPGPAIVQVTKGVFKLYQGSCNPVIVHAGETFVEVPNVPVRAEAKGEIEWTTTLLYESGQNASTPASDPCG